MVVTMSATALPAAMTRPRGAGAGLRARRWASRQVAVARLRSILERAASLDLADQPSWQRLRDEARVVIESLVAACIVPRHLAVHGDEPAVVVRRTVAAAWRYAARWQPEG